MLIRKPQVHIVFREVALATGELVRAYFAVIESEGVREVRFLGTRPIEASAPEAPIMLAAPRACASYCDIFVPAISSEVSPFYTLDFLTSQLARAPSAR